MKTNTAPKEKKSHKKQGALNKTVNQEFRSVFEPEVRFAFQENQRLRQKKPDDEKKMTRITRLQRAEAKMFAEIKKNSDFWD